MPLSEMSERLREVAEHAAKLSKRDDLLVTIRLHDYGYYLTVQREVIGFKDDIVRLHRQITWEAAEIVPNVLKVAIDQMVQQVDQ